MGADRNTRRQPNWFHRNWPYLALVTGFIAIAAIAAWGNWYFYYSLIRAACVH